jgi:hypothetical protein
METAPPRFLAAGRPPAVIPNVADRACSKRKKQCNMQAGSTTGRPAGLLAARWAESGTETSRSPRLALPLLRVLQHEDRFAVGIRTGLLAASCSFDAAG